MVELEMELTNKDMVEWLREIEANLHKDEVLRFRFSGILVKDELYSSVSIDFAYDLKFCLGSRLEPFYLYRYFFNELKTLPFWEEIHKDRDCISVGFEAKAISFRDNILTLLLPDSYEAPRNTIYLPEAYTKPMRDFVTIDFETIRETAFDNETYSHLPISVGMIKVIDGEIVDGYYSLIKPPTDEKWYGIKSGLCYWNCKDAPSYPDILPQIEEFIGGLQPVAYNCGTERGVFKDMENYYQIRHSFIHHKGDKVHLHPEEFIDPLKMLKTFGETDNELSSVCKRKYIYISKSHDALEDAKATAKLLLKLDKEKSRFDIATKKASKKKTKPGTSGLGKSIPEENVKYPGNPFLGKVVCCTEFSYEIKEQVENIIKDFGASVTRSAHHKKLGILVVGPSPAKNSKKAEVAEEAGARIIRYWEFLDILSEYGIEL